jgi:hypothetical protein
MLVQTGGTTARDGGSAAARWDEQEVCYIVIAVCTHSTQATLHYSNTV